MPSQTNPVINQALNRLFKNVGKMYMPRPRSEVVGLKSKGRGDRRADKYPYPHDRRDGKDS